MNAALVIAAKEIEKSGNTISHCHPFQDLERNKGAHFPDNNCDEEEKSKKLFSDKINDFHEMAFCCTFIFLFVFTKAR